MAETTAPLDKLVFDFAFDIIDVIPVLFKVTIDPRTPRIQAGQAVNIIIHIVDDTTTYGRVYSFNPGEKPQITIYKPDNTTLLAATDMEQMEQGIYRYRYQTSVNDVAGAYAAVFTAVNGSMSMRSRKHVVFVIL